MNEADNVLKDIDIGKAAPGIRQPALRIGDKAWGNLTLLWVLLKIYLLLCMMKRICRSPEVYWR